MRTALLALILLSPSPAFAQGGDTPQPDVGRGGRYALRFHTREQRIEGLLIGESSHTAIDRGIAWLLTQQAPNGAWRPDPVDETAATDAASVGTTSLAILALLGDGRVGSKATEAAKFLLTQQDAASGRIGATVHEHALATLALAETWNLTADARFRAPLELAVADLIAWQRKGAWATKKGAEGEPALTAWATLALQCAVEGGLAVPEKTTTKTAKWLVTGTSAKGAVKRVRGSKAARERGVAATLCVRHALADEAFDTIELQAGRLMKHSAQPARPEGDARADYQYWFWGTHGLRAYGDRRWSEWHAAAVEALLPNQREDGGWSANGVENECNGRVWSTALAVLTLECPYRFRVLGSSGAVTAGGSGPKPSGSSASFGDRFGKRRNVRKAGGDRDTAKSVAAGLEWLAKHQSPEGYWDSDGFAKHHGGGCECDGKGDPLHDVGVTGLALLAFLGDGNTPDAGPYQQHVAKGVQWLVERQDDKYGQIGLRRGHSWIYDHAAATFALAEAYLFTSNPDWKGPLEKAVGFLIDARHEDGGWRYDFPGRESDTSATGWAFLALKTAYEAGIQVPGAAFDGSLFWFDKVTNEGNGRVGYDSKGSVSARVAGVNDHFPPDHGEANTAISMICRRFAGESADSELMTQQSELLLKQLPTWSPDEHKVDMYFWYYGTYAMFQVGGTAWKSWNTSLKRAVLAGQLDKDDVEGSWDPVGPWGFSGGRVYSTALMVLSLEVYYRYEFLR
ncbi:MAG: hypothetical protein GY711_16645 [bacterium]|nr:hypothetical protein [bacterium]